MKTANRFFLLAGAMCAMISSCSKADLVPDSNATQIITATVTLPSGPATKVSYSENASGEGLTSVWNAGDKIQAITNTGAKVTFTLVSGAGEKTATFQAEAAGITDATVWQAILGSHISDNASAVNCTYTGQNGTISDLGSYDFTVTSSTGLYPSFNFAGDGQRLTYAIRIKLPAGIKSIEYSPDAYWAVTKDAVSSSFHDAVQSTTISLPAASSANDIVYLAVPAIKHEKENAGHNAFTLAFFNSDRTKACTKVLNVDLSGKGGRVGTADFTGMTLGDNSTATPPEFFEDNGEDVPPILPSTTLYGYVTDNNGAPISGVVVSDGFSCCKTDETGLYQMSADANARTVSVTVPSAYEIPATFYHVLGSKVNGRWGDKNFTLTARAQKSKRATIIAIADPHIKDNTGLDRFGAAVSDINSTITALGSGIPVGTPANAPAGDIVCISLGDQMWDNMSLAANIKAAYGHINAPVFFTIGNHDYNNSESTGYAAQNTFINNFGPLNYSFDIANIHVMVMNDIIFTGNGSGTIKQSCGFTQAEVDWLKADIAKVSDAPNKIGILCVHAPLSSASSGDSGTLDAVMSALKNAFYNVHVLSGHTHCVKNNLYKGWAAKSGRSIYEHTLQSLAGYFWEADISFDEGSPAGYGVMTFDSSQKDIYAEYNKVTKMPADFQMRVYNGNTAYGGYFWNNAVKSKYVVRLNDAGSSNDVYDTWTVSVNGNPMTRVESPIEDICVRAYVKNVMSNKYGEAKKTLDHFWYSTENFNSTFTVSATHNMQSGWSATYTSTHYIGTAYKGFAYGEPYD